MGYDLRVFDFILVTPNISFNFFLVIYKMKKKRRRFNAA